MIIILISSIAATIITIVIFSIVLGIILRFMIIIIIPVSLLEPLEGQHLSHPMASSQANSPRRLRIHPAAELSGLGALKARIGGEWWISPEHMGAQKAA